ncbi:VaFE repeat-containing surface-anchored protein, partial [Corynebacterium mastitidis]
MGTPEEIPFAGQQRDAAINLLKKLKKAHEAGNHGDAKAYNVALQLVLTSTMNKAESGLTALSPSQFDKVKQYLLEDGAYRFTQNERGQDIIKPVEGANIPKAADSEYITVIAPSNYDITKGAANGSQRIVPIDQPGLDDEPKKPESSEVPVPEETTSATERPAPKKPEIGTNADFAEGAKQVVAGATVNDTVTYKDLVPGKEYTLSAELIDKADGTTVVGSGSQKFTADESGSGEVVVPIKVNDDVTEPVEAAVAFETLKSDDAEAQENKAEDLPKGSADDVIAEHKDIDDEAQTVTSAEDQQAKIELKKYIGDQEFTGEEKPQSGGAGSAGVIDAQDADSAYLAKKDQDLTVTFAVKNTGALDLKDVTVSDELMTGEGFESSELSAISPEKQDIKVGETKYFTATLKAPAAGKLHGDKAKAEGTPVDEEGKETPFVDEDGKRHEPGDKVPSNEDPAHAKTSEAKTADVKLKKYIGAKAENADSLSVAEAEALNDSQTAEQAHKAKKADEDLTVAFVVENTGALDLKDLALSDAAIKEAFKNAVDDTEAGQDAGTPQVSNIRAVDAEKQKLLKPGEKMVFVGDLKAPAAGKLHADKADVAGTPVDEEGEPMSYTPVDEKGEPQKDADGNPVVNEPGTPVESQEDQAHTVTEPEFTPEIATSASVNADDEQKDFPATEDQTVFDTVTVSNLVEGASYTLDAQLMKKSDSSEIAGATAQKTFTADESGLDEFVKNDDGSVSGVVVVEIPLKAGSLKSGESAVAFETLTSADEKAQGHRAEELTDGSKPSGEVIADHKDINDAKQTVTYEFKDETKPNPGKPSESVPPSEQPENPVVNPSDESSDEPTPSSEKPVPEPSSKAPVETQEPTASVTAEPAEPSD